MTRKNIGELALCFGIIASLATADGLIKRSVEDGIKLLPGFPKFKEGNILNNTIRLNYLKNYGAALSIFKDNPEFVKSLSASLVGTGAANLSKLCIEGGSKITKAALVLMLSGGVSNTIDRFTKGYVVDYFSINKGKKLKNIVFNISDFEIFLGAILLCIGTCVENEK